MISLSELKAALLLTESRNKKSTVPQVANATPPIMTFLSLTITFGPTATSMIHHRDVQ
jgi:hypothetical protein